VVVAEVDPAVVVETVVVVNAIGYKAVVAIGQTKRDSSRSCRRFQNGKRFKNKTKQKNE